MIMKVSEMEKVMGKKVVFQFRMVRTSPPHAPSRVVWDIVPCERRDGWIVGFRFLCGGKIVHHGRIGKVGMWEDSYSEWKPEGPSHPAVMIVTDPRHRAVPVRPQDVLSGSHGRPPFHMDDPLFITDRETGQIVMSGEQK